MAIEGLHNLYRVPIIKKDKLPDDEREKRKKKKDEDGKEDDAHKQKQKKGIVDIRI